MAHFGVSITKKTAFRDSVQSFSNTYHYWYVGLNPSSSLANDIIDRLVVVEKTLHSSAAQFIYARLWSAGGSPSQNTMIFEKALNTYGTNPFDASIDRERAHLFQWSAGKDSRGRPVRLKKWFHSMGAIAGISVAGGVGANTSGFTEAQRTTLESWAAPLNPLVVNGSGMSLVSATNRGTDGNVRAHKYLEHHQLGDEWRG
jgi:hypothetical protein